MAAGHPPLQVGIYMSTGLLLVLEIRERSSSLGARDAKKATKKMVFRMLLGFTHPPLSLHKQPDDH